MYVIINKRITKLLAQVLRESSIITRIFFKCLYFIISLLNVKNILKVKENKMATIIQNKNELYEKYKFYRTIKFALLILIFGTLLYIYAYVKYHSEIIKYVPFLYDSVKYFV